MNLMQTKATKLSWLPFFVGLRSWILWILDRRRVEKLRPGMEGAACSRHTNYGQGAPPKDGRQGLPQDRPLFK